MSNPGDIVFTPGSRLDRIFGGAPAREGYHCNYGPNPAYRARFEAAGLRFTGFDAEGQIRAMELPSDTRSLSEPCSSRNVRRLRGSAPSPDRGISFAPRE